eukprot:CAMPEP_0198225036 /NCGR_PEP_ID=MMETSP1445-20131203/99416_1 /TAXON_ID=36898 /ORGANISM="Pyramimonas sp., Strain CCMP2087" /LENGTH=182 /DNA_ID=CAMNT_0043904411 /DNA_START=216 /DNA_END=764 /DNA_ORIENTATION=+
MGDAPPIDGGDDYLALPQDKMLQQCSVDYIRTSGPGGQHRNKTETGVRIKHNPSGITTRGTERRSRLQNEAEAVKRLKLLIATQVRRNVELPNSDETVSQRISTILPTKKQRLGPNHPNYPLGLQALLDLFDAYNGSMADTAKHLHLSTGVLSKLMCSNDIIFTAANSVRKAHDLHLLKKSN